MEWIDVNDRLPEDDTQVLIYTKLDKIYICWYFANKFVNYSAVSHWQPLPPTPNNHL